MALKLRWAVVNDLPSLIRIEEECFDYYWSEETFKKLIQSRNHVVIAAEVDGQVVGFMAYELQENNIDLLGVAVLPDYWRQGIAKAMVKRLKDKLRPTGQRTQARATVTARVRETNTRAHYFFKAMGFKAVRVIEGNYADTDEAAYAFEYTTE